MSSFRIDLRTELEAFRDGKAMEHQHEWRKSNASYMLGFDAAIPLIEELAEALEFYGSSKNWYHQKGLFPPDKIKINMVIASIDTEGHDWVGGRQARSALTKLRDRLK